MKKGCFRATCYGGHQPPGGRSGTVPGMEHMMATCHRAALMTGAVCFSVKIRDRAEHRCVELSTDVWSPHRCAEPRTGVWSRARVCGALHRNMEPSTGVRGPACHLVSPQGPRNQAVLSYRGVGSCPTHPLFAGYSSELCGHPTSLLGHHSHRPSAGPRPRGHTVCGLPAWVSHLASLFLRPSTLQRVSHPVARAGCLGGHRAVWVPVFISLRFRS